MTELTERLNIRVTLEQKEALFRCAMKRGETLSAYLVRRGLEEESGVVVVNAGVELLASEVSAVKTVCDPLAEES